jgi:hypothetical protein
LAAVFTPSGYMSVFLATSEGPYGYCGKYRIDDGANIVMMIQGGIVEDLNGSVQIRQAQFPSANQMIFTGKETHTGRPFELGLERVD